MKKFNVLLFLSLLIFFAACATRVLKYEKAEGLKKIEEFDQQVKIVLPVDPTEQQTIDKPSHEKPQEGRVEILPPVKAPQKTPEPPKKIGKAKKEKPKSTLHEPALENSEGFLGRRPIVDPFRVGEKVVHSVSWAKINAGKLSFEVKPFAEVNGQRSYQFQMQIWTNSFFNSVYSVEDKLISLVDFETLVPSVFTLHLKHTTELRESRAFFEQKTKTATYWEKKVTSNDGEKEKKIQWPILDYSQNVYSALFYLRTFQWKVGVTHQFRVADDGENLIFKAKAIRKEKIETDVGTFDAIVIQPQVELKGIAKPVGDIFMWLSDDDRKYILRIESKVKIGTFVTEISEFNPGQLE